ncbi:carbamoyltransferase HypF [Candidatus Contubernalis alkaliaceticus]|uniref:carbamoyltransferase HypF n=1 Tax=Candidatus Contubernalis alkaliaceticus TaxID=338645 RepID=UPI001F4BDB0F|nr:carbamoyltransferase HypF [Candidatus Contubernalis alkalaceticus]UNC92291.1 carbamoyltransferase HypF [Candidatus Contubernalis alkalaceticus]
MDQGYAKSKKQLCWRITVKGIVQGVGFRPYVYNLALKHGLIGTVLNSTLGVIIEILGEENKVEGFYNDLLNKPPRLSVIRHITREVIPQKCFKGFTILTSQKESRREALVPPDVGCCQECKQDMLNPKDRHYLYPFTNCTNCGPRFTLIKDVPYDRDKTSMEPFPMCDECYRDYHEPTDRRFHAQPIACSRCGPEVALVDEKGCDVPGNWLDNFWKFMGEGMVIAIKSLGGFHLACDAHSRKALAALRKRKNRPFKPFAVMARDLDTIKTYCFLGEQEEELLLSPEAPIVILKKRKRDLFEDIAPNLKTLGIMLPYTPLHFLLFNGPFELLVMTSANLKDLPLTRDNEKALIELKETADYFLWHNRDIVNRCDDSLMTVIKDKPQMYRRSRGYVPKPIVIPIPQGVRENTNTGKEEKKEVVLALGSEMKNTFCLMRGEQAFLSQYIGEMDSVESEEHFLASLEHFKRFFQLEPKILAYDMHPHYWTTRMAGEIPAEEKFSVQHHHAHMASCMAENGLNEPVIGIILDGTGYGLDGKMWGFEFFTGDYLDFQREIHLSYLPLPGGEMAVKQPWRAAVSYLITCLGEKGKTIARERFIDKGKELEAIVILLEKNFNCPPASSCGRFFDAVSAFLGVCETSSYEGQAAIELGELVLDRKLCKCTEIEPYPFTIEGGIIDPASTWKALVEDFQSHKEKDLAARRFHDTLVSIIEKAVLIISERSAIKKVVFSGGAWHNQYLLIRSEELLNKLGFEVFTHQNVPPNDGGISLGQAVITYWRWLNHVSGSSGKSYDD